MRKLILLLLTAALLVTPALAEDGPEEIPPEPDGSPHRFDITVIREATCAEKGILAYTCTKCGLTYTGEIPPTGRHDYTETRTEPTCTAPGQASYVCALCGEAYTEDLPALGHDYVYQYDAEFDADGTILSCGTWLCARCGRVLAATEGNVLYYYGQDQAPEEMQEDAPAQPEQTAPARPRNGLWALLAAGALVLLAAEAVVLLRAIDREKLTR